MDFLLMMVLTLWTFFSGITSPSVQTNQQPVSVSESMPLVKVVRVVDGDTIVVEFAGEEKTVRYIGIDTPEPHRDGEPACFSQESSLRNKELVQNKLVRLESGKEDKDKYDRLLRYVYVEDVFVNELLLKEGYAKTLTIKPNITHSKEFEKLETIAQENKLGLWAECQ